MKSNFKILTGKNIEKVRKNPHQKVVMTIMADHKKIVVNMILILSMKKIQSNYSQSPRPKYVGFVCMFLNDAVAKSELFFQQTNQKLLNKIRMEYSPKCQSETLQS